MCSLCYTDVGLKTSSHIISTWEYFLTTLQKKKMHCFQNGNHNNILTSKCGFFSYFLIFPLFLTYSAVSDGDDAQPPACEHWPSARGLVPVHLLWLLRQPGPIGLPVQLPACHWGVCCAHLRWVRLDTPVCTGHLSHSKCLVQWGLKSD